MSRRFAITLAGLFALSSPLRTMAAQTATSPLAGVGVKSQSAYTAEELAELNALSETVERFSKSAAEMREATRQLLEYKYKQKRDTLYDSYEAKIVALEVEQRGRRDKAIAQFEDFLRKYPRDDRYTPDAMFRLSELYFERSYDAYFQLRIAYDKAVESFDPSSGAPEPQEPLFHYEPTIAMMQRLITEFPDYRLLDGAYYLLGYCLGEQGEEERAVDVFEELVAKRPDSRFGPEVWTRIGEYYFNANELQRALAAYTNVLPHQDSPFYDKALYKLAWTHYRLADPERAPEEFQAAVDIFTALLDFNEKTKTEGKERGGDLRAESIQYMAISYADEQWGGLPKLLGYFESIGHRSYEREVIVALGDVYFDQTRFLEAIAAYRSVQEKYAEHADAPVIQDKIVQAFERNRDFEQAALERALLTKSYSEGAPWHVANQGNDKALAQAKKLTEQSLYTAALFHHKQAQIHKEAQKLDLAKTEYEKAANAYGEYLRRFPHDKQLYELTFYYAECLYYSLQFSASAENYKKVRDSNADDKFLEESAFSVILSYENAIKLGEARGELKPASVRKSTDRAADEQITPKEIPALKLSMIEASDRYAAVAPNSERVPKVLYKAAETFYIYDHFEEARARFESLLLAYPQDEVAEFSSNLIIESYLSEKNYVAVERFSRGLLERPASVGRKEFKGDLVKFKTGAMFKLAEELDQAGEYEKAAELYLKMIDENPQSQFADSALNNAAVAYEKVKRFDSASKLYERLVAEHPKSALADTALFRVGLNAERFFDFDKAISSYTKLVDQYPKSERRADAVYNAALSLENTQDYERAAKQYLRYCEVFKTRDDAPQVCFRAGTVYEKMGEPKRVISTYEAFIKKYQKSATHADRVIEAQLKIAQAYDKLGKDNDARKFYEATVKAYQRGKDPKSAPYAAESQFRLVEREFKRFAAIALKGKSKEQKKALTQKAEVLKKVEEQYKAILGFKQIDWTLAALFRIGQLYQEFADSLVRAPCPPDVAGAARAMGATAEEVCDEYRVILEEQSAGIEDKAVTAYETVITRAREFQVVNKWTKQTLVMLNKLRSKLWPLQKDAKTYVDAIALPPPSLVDRRGFALVQRNEREKTASANEQAPAEQEDQQTPAPPPQSPSPDSAPPPPPPPPSQGGAP